MSTLTAQTFPRMWAGIDGQYSQLYPATNISPDGQSLYFLMEFGDFTPGFSGYVTRVSTSNPSTYEILSADYFAACPFPTINNGAAHPGMYVAAQNAYYFVVFEDIPASSDVMSRIVRYDIDADTFTWSGRLVPYVVDVPYTSNRLMYDEADDVLYSVQFTDDSGNVDLVKIDPVTLAVLDTLANVGSPDGWWEMGAMVLNPTRHHLLFAHVQCVTVIDLDTFTIVHRIEGESDVEKGTLWKYHECVAHGNYLWVEAFWNDSYVDPDIRKYVWNGSQYIYASTLFDSTLNGFGWPSINYCPSEDALVFVGYTNGGDYTDPNDMALQLIDADSDTLVDNCPFGTARDEYWQASTLMVNPAGGMFVMGPGFIYSDVENHTSDMWTYVPSLATVTRQPQVQIIA